MLRVSESIFSVKIGHLLKFSRRNLAHIQATELCGEKAANLQTTLIHLQWQRKHVERAVQDLGTGVTTANGIPDEASEETAPIVAVAGSTKDDYLKARSSSRSRMGSSTAGISSQVALASPGENKMPNSRPAAAEPGGLEMLQLTAKGQALSSAVMVVEGVLHKMEKQARSSAVCLSWCDGEKAATLV